MEYKEYRKGNEVYGGVLKTPCKITKISPKKIIATSERGVEFEQIIDIKITMSILDKIEGFECSKSRDELMYSMDFESTYGFQSGFRIYFKQDGDKFILSKVYALTLGNNWQVVDIKFFHELQNFYYYLTDKELMVKPYGG